MDRIASTFSLKGEMARDTSLYCFMGCNQRLGWMVRTSKDMMRKLGRRREDIRLWTLKDIRVHTNVHQRVISAEEGFNTQEDRITYCADTNQPHSPAVPVIAQRAQEQRDQYWSSDGVLVRHTHNTNTQSIRPAVITAFLLMFIYITYYTVWYSNSALSLQRRERTQISIVYIFNRKKNQTSNNNNLSRN